MKITVINGTEVRGITYRMKELFLDPLRGSHEITEFYLPKDMPHFCCGCKVCFFKSETLCPHAAHTMPIWNAMLEADLLVFAAPVYVLRTPGQVKALLDHFACRWMVHRPDARMFQKKAVILTNSIGAPNGAAQKDIATSLTWLGISHIRKLGVGLMEGVIWDEFSQQRRAKIEKQVLQLAKRYTVHSPAHRSIKTRVLWGMSKTMHKALLKKESVPSADNRHWIDHGWINDVPPQQNNGAGDDRNG